MNGLPNAKNIKLFLTCQSKKPLLIVTMTILKNVDMELTMKYVCLIVHVGACVMFKIMFKVTCTFAHQVYLTLSFIMHIS